MSLCTMSTVASTSLEVFPGPCIVLIPVTLLSASGVAQLSANTWRRIHGDPEPFCAVLSTHVLFTAAPSYGGLSGSIALIHQLLDFITHCLGLPPWRANLVNHVPDSLVICLSEINIKILSILNSITLSFLPIFKRSWNVNPFSVSLAWPEVIMLLSQLKNLIQKKKKLVSKKLIKDLNELA